MENIDFRTFFTITSQEWRIQALREAGVHLLCFCGEFVFRGHVLTGAIH